MFLILTITDIVVVMTGLFCLWRRRPVFLLLVLIINTIDLVNENLLVLHARNWWHVTPNLFYNFYSLLEIIAWTFIYLSLFHNRLIRIFVLVLGSASFLYSLAELFVIHSLDRFHTASYALFSCSSLALSILYLFLVNRKEYHRLREDAGFWICASAICFHAIFLLDLMTMMDPAYWMLNGALEVFHYLQSAASLLSNFLLCTAFIIYFYRYRKTAIQASS